MMPVRQIRSTYSTRPPRRPRLVKPKSAPLPMDRPAALAVIRQAKYAAQSVFGVCPDPCALGRAVAIAGHSTLPWLDHERVLGVDSAKWCALAAGLREVWAEQRKERG